MKKITILLCALALTLGAKAQSPTFSQSDFVINAGIGFGTSLYSGSYYKSTLPPVSISAEYGVADDFLTSDMTLGIGGYLGFAGSKYEINDGYGNKYGWKYNYTVIGARGVVHYPFVDKLDTYAGVMLGYNIINFTEIGNVPGLYSSDSGHPIFSLFAGARYYITDNFALMGELGYGIAYLNLGVAFKL